MKRDAGGKRPDQPGEALSVRWFVRRPTYLRSARKNDSAAWSW